MKIVVLAGGSSSERDVSLVSGVGIYKALKNLGHQCIILDPFLGYEGDYEDIFDADIDWTSGIENIKSEKADIEKLKQARGGDTFFGLNVLEICQLADVVYIGLHGENGENGRLQACFDLYGIRYTGTDYRSSAICIDKALTKDLLQVYEVATPKGVHLRRGEELKESFVPCVVKACKEGSSIGVYLVKDEGELDSALKSAFEFDDEVVVEEFIEGREFSVGVVDGVAYPVIEIMPKEGFYDYKNKYQAGATVEVCPAELSEEDTLKVQRLAEKAYRALRLKAYARLDFMRDNKGNFYCLEANTLPGMTPTSLLPQEAAALGISYEELCAKVIALAFKED